MKKIMSITICFMLLLAHSLSFTSVAIIAPEEAATAYDDFGRALFLINEKIGLEMKQQNGFSIDYETEFERIGSELSELGVNNMSAYELYSFWRTLIGPKMQKYCFIRLA